MVVPQRAPTSSDIVNEQVIESVLSQTQVDSLAKAREVINKARECNGLSLADVATLLQCTSRDIEEELFAAAREVKEAIYGNRIVLFAPLYISNHCRNECLYCAFRRSNKGLQRRQLTQEEIQEEVRQLAATGQKRLLLVAAEGSQQAQNEEYIIRSLTTVYGARPEKGEIRRINVNVAPMSIEGFRRLKACGIGTYQVFQETYHRPTYQRLHPAGPKSDYVFRIEAPQRAMEAGIDDVGLGVLFGLADYRFEVLALLQHIRHLESRFGVGPHTISVPRIEPADGSPVSETPPCPVTNEEFLRIVAVLRLAVPYAGLILSTRETPALRQQALALGVSQMSAGSRTTPGGYGAHEQQGGQFELGDHRPLEEVVTDLVRLGYLPSFCTACYRKGRTGQAFMGLAQHGHIGELCSPNGLITFKEYLEDFAGAELKNLGTQLIERHLETTSNPGWCEATRNRLKLVEDGQRDVFF